MMSTFLPASIYAPCFGVLAPQVYANGYHPFPIPAGQKRANWRGWQRWSDTPPSNAEVGRWVDAYPAHSLAIACGRVIAADNDAVDPERAEAIDKLLRLHLGEGALVRYGQAPRRIRLYRAPEGTLLPTRRLGAIEILGRGAYFLAFGIHPGTGRPYYWQDDSPADRPCDTLPVCAPESLDALVSAFRAESGTDAREEVGCRVSTNRPAARAGFSMRGCVRQDARWVLDTDGRVVDGRDAFLAAQVYRAFANGCSSAEEIADVAFAAFLVSADLVRGKRDGKRAWSHVDALAKARALLGTGKARPRQGATLTAPGATTEGFWTPATRHAFAQATNAAGAGGRLPPAAVAVSAAMLNHVEGDGASFVAVETIARALGLHPDTVKKVRRKLIEAGFWTTERVRGGRGHLAYYRPSPEVLARHDGTERALTGQIGPPNTSEGESFTLPTTASLIAPSHHREKKT